VRGLLLGVFVPATLMIIFRNLPKEWWLPAISVFALRVGLSLNLGVSAVGFYVEHFGWQWLFWQDVLIAPLMGLFVRLGSVPEPVDQTIVEQADWGGMLLLGAGLAMIYSGLDQGNRLDWLNSGVVAALLAAGGFLCACFLVNEARVEKPWAPVRAVRSWNLAMSLAMIVLYSMASLSNIVLVPNFLGEVAGLRPEQMSTVFLLSVCLPMISMMPLAVVLLRRLDARYVVLIGLAAFLAAALLGTRITHDWAIDEFRPVLWLQAVGHSFALLPVIVIALSNADPKHATAVVAYIQATRLAGAEVCNALMSTWLRVREQLHSNLLGLHVTNGDPDHHGALDRITSIFSTRGSGDAHARGLEWLSQVVHREASVLSYIDGFWLTVWLSIAAIFGVALLRSPPPGPLVPAD
jgi:MFS transporter, DHA2 family, multidrug resistance protein